VKILAPVGMLQAIGTTTGQIYTAKGRTDLMLRWGVMVVPFVICSFVAGLPWGARGVAVAYAIVMFLQTYPLFKIPFRLIDLPVRELWRVVQPHAVTSLIMFAMVLAVRHLLPANLRPIAVMGVAVPQGL
jgi:O-antigen/teichoic acid export membrane protein